MINIKGFTEEDFLQYKVPCMFLIFPHCTFKCDKEYGTSICQNSSLASTQSRALSIDFIIKEYKSNDIIKALCCGGLEPLDSFLELLLLVKRFREEIKDPIVIYTGYTEEEVQEEVVELKKYPNIIIKFGRYIPNQKPHYDEILGISLASDNQYAKKIS